MYKHFTYSDRIKLQYNLDYNILTSASDLALALNKTRKAIYYELQTNKTTYKSKDEAFNDSKGFICLRLERFPYVCNGCSNKRCSHLKAKYLADEAHYKSRKTLVKSRSNTKKIQTNIKTLNHEVSPHIKNGQSIYVARINSNCKISESTIRRYIDKDRLIVKRHNLPQAVRFKVKKEYDYSRIPHMDINTLNGRTYEDYLKHLSSKPSSKIIQVDSIIGKATDKYAILTIYFLEFHLQLGIKYERKHPRTENKLRLLHNIGSKHGYIIYDTVLADNGGEFRSLHKLEYDSDTGEFICKTFYTDPYRSCQKAECERNHGLFRRIHPKGKSVDDLSQQQIDDIFSRINSYPRSSLKGKSPYDLFIEKYGPDILSELNIFKVSPSKLKFK